MGKFTCKSWLCRRYVVTQYNMKMDLSVLIIQPFINTIQQYLFMLEQQTQSSLSSQLSLQTLKLGLQASLAEKYIHMEYQNLIMDCIEAMNPGEAKQFILQEQSKLLSNKSAALKIQSLMQARKQVIDNILATSQNLEESCYYLDELRKINLKVCETIFGLRDSLSALNFNGDLVSQAYSSFFNQLNSDNKPILKSQLKNYIKFTAGYDPFFLHPYEVIEAEGNTNDLPEPISRLFKMNISYIYRLIKVRNELIQCLSLTSLPNDKHLPVYIQRGQTQGYMTSNREFEKQKGKKIMTFRTKRYETVDHDHEEETTSTPSKKFVRRFLIKSEPKNYQLIDCLRKDEDSKAMQRKENHQRRSSFKIRDFSEKKKSANIREEEYQLTEDEQINVFRRKMRARRERRKKMSISEIMEASESDDDFNNSFPKKLYQNKKTIRQIGNRKLKKQSLDIKEDTSSSDQDFLQPRGLDENPKNRKLPERFEKIRVMEAGHLRQVFRTKKQKIRLQPLNQYNLKLLGKDAERRESPPIHRKMYLPLSPEILEVNGESSSERSEMKEVEVYTGERQEQLFNKVNRQSEDNLEENLSILQLKKMEQSVFRQTKVESWAESEEIIPIEETNETKFKDEHIRRAKNHDTNADFILKTKQCIKKEKYETSKSQGFIKQTPSEKKDLFVKKEKIQEFTCEESSEPFLQGKHSESEQTQKILRQMEEEMSENPIKKKQIKMKPGQIQLADLYAFIEKQKINELQRKQFEIGLWKENINLKHSYLTKFYMNSELAAFGISSPRYDGDFSILYWGTTCAEGFTSFLFRKYLDYLEKFTNLNNIYIGFPLPDADFVAKGSSFIRGRKNFAKRELPYIPFLSFECSNICFELKTLNKELSIFFSEEIEEFSEHNSRASSSIILCKSDTSSLNFPKAAKFYQNIGSIKEANQILEKSNIDTYATSEKLPSLQCNLFTLKDHCSIKSNYFYVRNGYFVPQGREVYAKDKKRILKLEMGKDEYHLYFGKKFSNLSAFLENCDPNSSGATHSFAFKMFSKQLYGRISNKKQLGMGYYGNWDINFLWQDQLKGTVIKEMPSSEFTFGPDNYFVALHKSEMLLFAFQVKPSDFFF